MSNVDGEWEMIYYESFGGKKPVQGFIEELNLTAQRKVVEALRLLRVVGTRLRYPQVKKLVGTDIWELRILGSNNLRILYVVLAGRKILLLHGFLKKKQKTDGYEVKTASKRLKEYLA